ncbi:hypothetical protein UPYG_G00054120 [Umbra pygmaea]|uniref:C2H2 AKAP95-type domain-containing protein n=1 Tax=Umbra pygmaea TaxID=75934 RepID=A0ABD0XBN6_UMBPY
MDGRSYGSGGYSSWGGSGGGSGSRGSGKYDLYGGGYKDSMSGLGGYGGGYGGGGRLSGSSLLSSTGTSADAVIAKINQRLDMLTQLEGGMKGGSRSDRFDQYESFDSLSSRDLYRSVALEAVVEEDGPEQAAAPRDGAEELAAEAAEGLEAAGLTPLPWLEEGAGGVVVTPIPPGEGASSHPSLATACTPRPGPRTSQGATLEGVHGLAASGGARGPSTDSSSNNNSSSRSLVGGQRDGQKKRKQTLTAADEPESKMNKTEMAGGETANEPAEKNGEAKVTSPSATKAPADGEQAVTMQEELSQVKKKLQTGKQTPPQDKTPKSRKRRGGFLDRSGVRVKPRDQTQRVTFACSVCKFRSFFHEDMAAHLESKFHKDHFKFLTSQLSKPTTDFLQEYLNNKYQKTAQRTSKMENHSAAICQVYKEQDLTRDLGMEHFMRKVEAAHCAACDLFIPMQFHLIQKHLKSSDHNFNRKGMMEQSKRASLSVARSILNHKVIGKKLESYLKGENPFLGNLDDQDPDDSMMEVSEAEMTNESLVEAEPCKEEAVPEAAQAAAASGGTEEKMEEGAVVVAEGEEEETPVVAAGGEVKQEEAAGGQGRRETGR